MISHAQEDASPLYTHWSGLLAMVELRCADSTLLDFCRLIDPTRKGRLLFHCNDNRHINVIRTTLV